MTARLRPGLVDGWTGRSHAKTLATKLANTTPVAGPEARATPGAVHS